MTFISPNYTGVARSAAKNTHVNAITLSKKGKDTQVLSTYMEVKMRKHSWEAIQEISKSIAEATIIEGAIISVEDIFDLAPMLWLDFLNADTNDAGAMWIIYREFKRAMADLISWVLDEGHAINQEVKDMKLLSKEEFLRLYPQKFRASAEKLQRWIRKTINETIEENLPQINTDDPPIELCFLTVRADSATYKAGRPYKLELKTCEEKGSSSEASDPDLFWLSIIMAGIESFSREGKIIHRCANPECGTYFIPSPRSHGQRYHSVKCQNRHYYIERTRVQS